MSKNIGIIYSSVDGHTKKICERLHTFFTDKKVNCDLYSVDEFNKDLLEYQVLIIGASIRYGKHSKSIINFIDQHKTDFKKITTAFFSVNLVARKKEKSSPDTNPYMLKFLKFTNWKADILEVFAGKLDYASYGLLDKWMIKLIMKFTNGPTKTDKPIEYTDWDKVDDFGKRIAEEYIS
jgi:menaquinone-dependent protoporphyrinogen oxidase